MRWWDVLRGMSLAWAAVLLLGGGLFWGLVGAVVLSGVAAPGGGLGDVVLGLPPLVGGALAVAAAMIMGAMLRRPAWRPGRWVRRVLRAAAVAVLAWAGLVVAFALGVVAVAAAGEVGLDVALMLGAAVLFMPIGLAAGVAGTVAWRAAAPG